MEWKVLHEASDDWLMIAEKIDEKDWNGAHHLAKQMRDGVLSDWEGVIAVFDQSELAGFCSYVKRDIVETISYSPYIATVYVDPDYRGQHLSQQLVRKAEEQLQLAGFSDVYLVTQHHGLYEKLGYQKFDEAENRFGEWMSVYQKSIAI